MYNMAGIVVLYACNNACAKCHIEIKLKTIIDDEDFMQNKRPFKKVST